MFPWHYKSYPCPYCTLSTCANLTDKDKFSRNMLTAAELKDEITSSQHFRSFWGAWRTIAGYEAIHIIRKGQACWSAAGAKIGLLHRFIVGMFGMEA
jgi:uncharacterized protein (DUF2147 family)